MHNPREMEARAAKVTDPERRWLCSDDPDEHIEQLAPYLDLLEELSKAGGVSYYSVAAPFIGPLKKGFELLTGTSDEVVLEIGLASTMDTITTGTYFVARLEAEARQAHAEEPDAAILPG